MSWPQVLTCIRKGPNVLIMGAHSSTKLFILFCHFNEVYVSLSRLS